MREFIEKKNPTYGHFYNLITESKLVKEDYEYLEKKLKKQILLNTDKKLVDEITFVLKLINERLRKLNQ